MDGLLWNCGMQHVILCMNLNNYVRGHMSAFLLNKISVRDS